MGKYTGKSLQRLQYNNMAAEQSAATVENWESNDSIYDKDSNMDKVPDNKSSMSDDMIVELEKRSIQNAKHNSSSSADDMQIDFNMENDRIRALKEAVIMSEIISLPVCKRAKRRRLL